MRALRAAIPAEEADVAACAAAEQLVVTPEFARAARVVAYVPLSHELSTEPLFARVRCAGKSLLLPRMDDTRGVLEFALFAETAELRRGRYGVLEPTGAAVPALTAEDLVVVPGLAFDRVGHRLGNGAGWYDRTFAAQRNREGAARIGFAFHIQLLDCVPSGPRDRCVDAVVTERIVLRAQ